VLIWSNNTYAELVKGVVIPNSYVRFTHPIYGPVVVPPDQAQKYKLLLNRTVQGLHNVLPTLMSYLPDADLMIWRLVSKTHKQLAERILKGILAPWRKLQAIGASSIDRNLQLTITQEIAKHSSFRLSVDQLTQSKLISQVTGNQPGKLIAINAGRYNPALTSFKNRYAVVTLEGSNKMHNKFWLLGGSTLITGSPNVSVGGLKDNLECIVVLKHPWVASIYREYFEHIRAHKSTKLLAHQRLGSPKAFADRLVSFNQQNRVRVALAPFLSIGDFIYEELGKSSSGQAVKITLRQFLVDKPRKENPKDILIALTKLRALGAEVEVVIDKGQYDNMSFVQKACQFLRQNGVKVWLQQRATGHIMHDKLFLVTYTKNSVVTKTVLIGSAGLTQNVTSNQNYENIIAIDEDTVYDYFLDQHKKSLNMKGIDNFYWD
jgi:phosphatidylserine/phosphatidylglycerophosphate/cardiolipin synthase-like enzyme